MIVNEQQYNAMFKEFDGMTFTPFTELIEETEEIENENGENEQVKVFKYKILKTADEVYQEYLENKDKPVEPQLSVEEEIKALKEENANLQSCILELADILGNK